MRLTKIPIFLFLTIFLFSMLLFINPSFATPSEQIQNGDFEEGTFNHWIYSSSYISSTYKYAGSYSARLYGHGAYIQYNFYPYLNSSSKSGVATCYAWTPNSSATFVFWWFYSDGTNQTSGSCGIDSSQWYPIGDNGLSSGKTILAMRIYQTSSVQIYVDNISFICDTYGSMTYIHIWTPTPEVSYSEYNIALNQSVVYRYNESIYYQGSTQTGISGTFEVYSSGTYSTYSDMYQSGMSLVLSGTITNGNFSFYISPRYDAQYNGLYEKLQIKMKTTLNGQNYVDYTETYTINWFNPLWTAPETSTESTLVLVLVYLTIMILPAIILAGVLGISGMVLGLLISIICLYVVGLIPSYVLFLMGLGIIFLLVAGGKQPNAD
jgi:hypothetical protein